MIVLDIMGLFRNIYNNENGITYSDPWSRVSMLSMTFYGLSFMYFIGFFQTIGTPQWIYLGFTSIIGIVLVTSFFNTTVLEKKDVSTSVSVFTLIFKYGLLFWAGTIQRILFG
jgi:hypothetical protein